MWFVVIDVLGESLGPVNQTVLALIAVLIALLLHIRAEPFQVAEIDTLERLSLTTSIFTLIAGLFYHGRVHYCEETNGLSHLLCANIHKEGWSYLMTTFVFVIQITVLLHFVRFVLGGAKDTYKSKRREKRKKKYKNEGENTVHPLPSETGPETNPSSGLPVAFVERHKTLQDTLKRIDHTHNELAQVAEALPGFKADVAAVQLWLSRMRGSVDWKERQADAVVRRHKWEEAHPEHKTALKTKKICGGHHEAHQHAVLASNSRPNEPPDDLGTPDLSDG